MSAQQDQVFCRLDKWLRILNDELIEMRVNQHIYEEVRQIVHENPSVQEPADFYEWMFKMYTWSQAATLRRLVDAHRDCISFRRLLVNLKLNPGVLTRSRFKAMFVDRDYTEHDADELFDQLVGPGKEYPETPDLDAELDLLTRKTKKLVDFVDRRVAHRDRGNIQETPTIDDLNAAIDHLEDLLRKYWNLFRGFDTPQLLPIWQYDWRSVFTSPWIQAQAEDESLQ